jgi:ATP-dependent DNA helicase RecQ
MLDYEAADACRMEFLRRELDDPEAAPCGRCDNCTGRHRSAEVSDAGAAQARDRLSRPGVEVTPRRMWPTGMKAEGISGRIPPSLQAEPGRALGRLTDLGWGNRLRRILADGAPDAPVSGEVFDAVVEVLSAWDWSRRPAGVVAMPSATRPLMIADLARRVATIGRLPYLGELAYTGAGPGPRRHNSAQRVRTLWNALAVPESVSDLAGPVLLVDDRADTGWTVTIAAKLLREAGAPAVLPLVLAVTS